MIAMTMHEAFLIVWLAFAVLGVGGFAAALIWALRRGQFSDSQRARELPLVGPPMEDDGGK